MLAVIGGGGKVLFRAADLPRYDYWAPSRAIDTTPGNNAITEFPYFTFLFADLHAHLMAIPFTILSLGLGLTLVLNARPEASSGDKPSTSRGRLYVTLGLVALLGLVVGALRWINSWDYPTFLIIALAVVFIAERVRRGRVDMPMLRRTVLLGALLALLSWVFFLPFSRNYALPATGFQGMPDPSELPRTPFNQYLSHFGVFIFLAGSLLTFLAYRAVRRRGPGRSLIALVATGVGIFVLATLAVGLAGPLSGPIPGITITGLSAGGFLGEIFTNTIPVASFSFFALAVVALLAWEEFRSKRPDTSVRLLVLGMIAMALLLSAGVEIAVLNPDIGRQNTVFKFYLQNLDPAGPGFVLRPVVPGSGPGPPLGFVPPAAHGHPTETFGRRGATRLRRRPGGAAPGGARLPHRGHPLARAHGRPVPRRQPAGDDSGCRRRNHEQRHGLHEEGRLSRRQGTPSN